MTRPRPVPGSSLRLTAGRFFDLLIFPAFLIGVTWEPRFADGFIDYSELGEYLGGAAAILRGAAPYRDIHLIYGPLSYYGPAAAMLFFGKTVATLKGLFLAGNIASALALWVLARLLIRRRLYAALGAILAALGAHHPFWSVNWGGLRFFFAHLFLLALLLHLRSGRRRWACLSGSAAALALLHSTDAGAVCLVAAAVAFAPARYRSAGARAWAAGLAGALLPVFAAMAWSGSLAPYSLDLFDPGYRLAWIQPVGAWGKRSLATLIFPGLVYAAAFLSPEDRTRTRGVPLLPAVAAYGAALYVFAFRALQGPQFAVALGPATVVFFHLIDRLHTLAVSGELGSFRRVVAVAALWGAVFYAALLPKGLDGRRWLRNWFVYQMVKPEVSATYLGFARTERLREPGVSALRGSRVPPSQALEIERVFGEVTRRTRPGERLLTYPDLSFFNFVCDRPPVGRFHRVADAWPKASWRAEALAACRDARPALALRATELSGLARSVGAREELLPEIGRFLDDGYASVLRAPRVEVLARRAD